MHADAIHTRYAPHPMGEQCASLYALQQIEWWLRRRRPEVVLEVGAGISTISALIHATLPGVIAVHVEDHPGCRAIWRQQMEPLPTKAFLVRHDEMRDALDAIGQEPDLVIIDGGDRRDDYYRWLAPRAVVVFEGNRRDQRAVFARMVCGQRRVAWASWKPADRSKGLHVALLDPTLTEEAWLAGVRVREGARDLYARAMGQPVGKKRRA